MVFNGGIGVSDMTAGAGGGSRQQRTCTGGRSDSPSSDVTTGSRREISSRQTEQTGSGTLGSAAMVFLVFTNPVSPAPYAASTPGARPGRRRRGTAALCLGALGEPRGIAGGVKRERDQPQRELQLVLRLRVRDRRTAQCAPLPRAGLNPDALRIDSRQLPRSILSRAIRLRSVSFIWCRNQRAGAVQARNCSTHAANAEHESRLHAIASGIRKRPSTFGGVPAEAMRGGLRKVARASSVTTRRKRSFRGRLGGGRRRPLRELAGACRRNPARAMRRVQLRRGARWPHARRTA